MTRAIDPFEDYLRRKKVEMLEEQYRGTEKPVQEPEDDQIHDNWTPPPARDDSPAREEQVEQEMNEFFSEGGSAGADLFERANVIDEERVDEIQDALDDVFEGEKCEPEAASGVDDTFVDFFKQVQTDFVPDEMVSREIVQPDAPKAPGASGAQEASGDFEDEPLTAEFPLEGEQSATEGVMTDAATAEAATTEAATTEAAISEALGIDEAEDVPAFLEVSPRINGADSLGMSDLGMHEQSAVATESRLELAEILAVPQEGEDLRQHVHLLSRLVVKLVERSNMPESEIIEVLIKSGVEF